MHTSIDAEFEKAIIINLKLKAKILAVLFGVIALVQVILIPILLHSLTDISTDFPKIAYIGPAFLFLAFIGEIYSFRYLNRLLASEGAISSSFKYMITFLEISFPSIVIMMICFFGITLKGITNEQILNSPPIFFYFIFIMLSSLQVDSKVSYFAGIVAGLQHLVLYLWFVDSSNDEISFLSGIVKSVFIAISGIVAGLISVKVRESLLSSLHAKNELIYQLDKKVAEKTEEVTNKNIILEEKNKNITDSIHYAKRIQQSLLPTEKYIDRSLKRLKKK